jgi:hypothetical protein
MQASDVVNLVDTLTYYLSVAIFLFAAFRALTIARHLVNRVYRSRAILLALLIIFTIIQSYVPDSWVIFTLPVYVLTYFLLLFFFLAVIDNTALVALQMDFFHRNTLHWRDLRILVYVVFLVDISVVYLFTNSGPPPNIAGRLSVIGSFVALFVYSALTLILVAKRTPDKPMRRFLEIVALLIIATVVSALISNYTDITAVDLFSDFLSVALSYLTYLAAMSLSLTGKISKDKPVPTTPAS